MNGGERKTVAGGAAVRLAVRRITRLEPEMLARLEEHGRAALGESALDRWLLPVIAEHGFLYVGMDDEEIVGAVEIIRCVEDGNLYLEGLYICPELQGQGYGSALMDAVIKELRPYGYRRLLATVDPGNTAGRRLYGKHGFEESGHRRDYYGPGRHRILLSLDLGSRFEKTANTPER